MDTKFPIAYAHKSSKNHYIMIMGEAKTIRGHVTGLRISKTGITQDIWDKDETFEGWVIVDFNEFMNRLKEVISCKNY